MNLIICVSSSRISATFHTESEFSGLIRRRCYAFVTLLLQNVCPVNLRGDITVEVNASSSKGRIDLNTGLVAILVALGVLGFQFRVQGVV